MSLLPRLIRRCLIEEVVQRQNPFPAAQRPSTLSDPRRVRRHIDGVSPTMRRSERVKRCWSHMPQLNAMECNGPEVVSIIHRATSMRRRTTWSLGDAPKAI
jgi:hypothetical protein